MAKLLKNIVAYFLLLYFFVAGVGFNVINYCCKACADKGIEAIAESSCFAVHHHTHAFRGDHQDVACDDIQHQPDGCHLYRLSTDTPSVQEQISLQIQQLPVSNLFVLPSFLTYDAEIICTSSNLPPPDPVFLQAGRTILSLHSVLLI